MLTRKIQLVVHGHDSYLLIQVKPPPKTGFIATLEAVRRTTKPKRWKSQDGARLYEWDGLHGELEVYDARGKHLGVAEPTTGVVIKPAIKGRSIDV